MVTTRFDIEKFSEKMNFGLWRIKMKALLVHQGLADALKGDSGESSTTDGEESSSDAVERSKMMEKVHSAIILCLGDKALREVSKESADKGVWDKLKSLYMVKTLANQFNMKHKLYAFKMVDEKHILEQLDEFNKVLDDLENTDIKMEEKDKALIILSSLPKSFENFKDIILFGRQGSITLEEVQVALKSKELYKVTDQASSSTCEGLTVKGKHLKKSNFKKGNTNKWRNKKASEATTDTDVRKCFHCHELGHYKKNCPKWKTFMKNLKGNISLKLFQIHSGNI
ncbi:hypothetical protein ACS0TY_008341 [Phlomoides rotata]